MYDRFQAADPTYDGRFFTGVATTGIYCLASCHARKAKRENVRFFPSTEAAREAGFRACQVCHPDDFAQGADPVLETIETVVAEVLADPGGFINVRAVVKRSGFGPTRVFELFRQHYHSTPAEVLLQARLDRVKTELVATDYPLAQVAGNAGFASLSVLHAHFRDKFGLTPAAYRALRSATSFTLTLPAGYPLPYLRRALSRDPQSVSERWTGDVYEIAVECQARPKEGQTHFAPSKQGQTLFEPSVLRLDFTAAPAIEVSLSPFGDAIRAQQLAVGLIGLEQDATAFARFAKRLGFARLVAGRPQLRISQTVSVFEGLMWAIIGQQINLPFAFALRRRLFELAGRPINGLFAAPTPAAVAELTVAQLKAIQFSRQKAEYLIGAARKVADGSLDLEGLRRQSATRAERTLLGLRGLGPWSVNYLMMRSLGYADCLPLGDTGVTSGLKHLFQLEERPDADATRRLMAVFSPYRSLATSHLWQLLQSAPEA
jgi:AraC family transcriptional regulator of adaptative response / DNA-3-methyladenine glycosylase II